jgi:putative membrane protein
MTPDAGRRLHHAAVGAEGLDGLRQLALPIVVVAIIGGGFTTEALVRLVALGIFGGVVSVMVAYAQWQATRWWIERDAVRLRRGVFTENITSIAYDRVQAVDTVRGPVQRLFGVVELHVQSAGGGRKGELVLKAVTPEEADELREAVRRGAPAEVPADPFTVSPEAMVGPAASSPVPGVELPGTAAPEEASGEEPASEPASAAWRLRRAPLMVAAVTSGSLGVLVPVLVGLSQVVDELFRAEEARRLAPATVGEAAVYAAAVLGAAWVLSVLGTVVAFARFSVTREGDRLRIRRGIIERREASVPVARVHAVRLIESPLREPFRVGQIRIETAGYAAEPATAQTLLPLVRRSDVPAVLAELLPELAVPLEGLDRPPARALRRYVLPPLVVATVTAGATVAVLGAAALPALAVVLVAVAWGVARHRTAGVRLDGEERLVMRSRGLSRTTAAIAGRRLQSVHRAANPFQRRARLATLSADVSSGRRFSVPHLDAEVSDALLHRLAAAATRPPER